MCHMDEPFKNMHVLQAKDISDINDLNYSLAANTENVSLTKVKCTETRHIPDNVQDQYVVATKIPENPDSFTPSETLPSTTLRQWVPLYVVAAGTQELLNFDPQKVTRYIPKPLDLSKSVEKYKSRNKAFVASKDEDGLIAVNGWCNGLKLSSQRIQRGPFLSGLAVVVFISCLFTARTFFKPMDLDLSSDIDWNHFYGNCTLYDYSKSTTRLCYFDEDRFLMTVSCTTMPPRKIISEIINLRRICNYNDKSAVYSKFPFPTLIKQASQRIRLKLEDSFVGVKVIKCTAEYLIYSYFLLCSYLFHRLGYFAYE